ncbi:MAG: VOC family protein [Neomegalonema sp.]|nr:VOC family protein [Neomegalonema sp.]
MPLSPRISMITLGVKNVAKAAEFYRDGLGFPQLEFDNPNVAFFTLNGSWLGLYGWDALAQDAGVAPRAPGYGGFALAHNVGSEQEVDQTLTTATTAGAQLIKPGQKVFWGGYSGYFADLDGHLWEVAHNPFMWIGPEDAPTSN